MRVIFLAGTAARRAAPRRYPAPRTHLNVGYPVPNFHDTEQRPVISKLRDILLESWNCLGRSIWAFRACRSPSGPEALLRELTLCGCVLTAWAIHAMAAQPVKRCTRGSVVFGWV